MPTVEAEKVIANNSKDKIPVELSMETIAEAQTAQAIRDLISPMVTAYGQWIDMQAIPIATRTDDQRPETANHLLQQAKHQRAIKRADLALLKQWSTSGELGSKVSR